MYLSNVEGFYGVPVVLLDGDTDLSSKLPKCGYLVTDEVPPDRLAALRAAAEHEVRERVQATLGPDADLEGFTIANYHHYVNSQETHEAVYRRLRNGFQLDRDPSPLGITGAEMAKCVSQVIGYDVDLWLGLCNLRLCRPGVADNNPLHRDVYLPRLRHMVNVYVPVAGSTEHTSLGMVPGSHRWPESDIMRTAESAKLNGRKFTVPAVVEVARGVKEATVVRPNPGVNEFMVFSPYLVHGGGSNERGQETRCSLEMRFCLSERDPLTKLPPLLKLGTGTIWYGVPWPPGAQRWVAPTQDEIVGHLKPLLGRAASAGVSLMIDTAAAYHDSEARLGQALDALSPEARERVVVATKFGEVYDKAADKIVTDFSISAMYKSLAASANLLGDLHVVYLHITSQISEEEAIQVLRTSDLFTEMLQIRFKGKYGVRKVGVTISNASLLQSIIAEDLACEFDVLQVPAWLVRQQAGMVLQWKKRRPGNMVVVNSPVRYKETVATPQEAYKTAAAPFVDVVLTGTRTHLGDTIAAVLD